jgi:hypothetical protein
MRTGENWRESWWIKNVTNKTIAIGDLHLLPSLKPNQQVDVLRYYTRERISHAKTLVALLKSGKLKLNKEKIFTNAFPGEISATEADEAVTPAEENEIAYSGTSSHEHDNEDILDGFDEDSSGLLWNGSPIEETSGRFTFTIQSGSNWNNSVIPVYQIGENRKIEITKVKSTAIGTGGSTLTFNLEERNYGSLNSTGTTLLISDMIATLNGVETTLFSNPSAQTIEPNDYIVFVTGINAESGTINSLTCTIYYNLVD